MASFRDLISCIKVASYTTVGGDPRVFADQTVSRRPYNVEPDPYAISSAAGFLPSDGIGAGGAATRPSQPSQPKPKHDPFSWMKADDAAS